MPVKIFFCYAHEDEALLNKLKRHLRPLQREGLIDSWYDQNIQAGMEWKHEINQHLHAAQIVLLLVSPDFIDSDYCYSSEMKQAIERHERREARVIPVILRPVDWQITPLARLLALPADGKPITTWRNRDVALHDVAREVGNVVRTLLSQHETPAESEADFPEKNRTGTPFSFHTSPEQVHQPAQLQRTISPRSNSDLPIPLQPLPSRLALTGKMKDIHSKHGSTPRKKFYRYIAVGLMVGFIILLISSPWWSQVLPRLKTQSEAASQTLNSPLQMSFDATESRLWVIPGDPTHYTLKNLPKKQQLPAALYTDGNLSAPSYHLYLELQNISKGQYSDISIRTIRLKILQVRPLPQRPVPLWADDDSFHYAALNKYKAVYSGSPSGFLDADYVGSDYITNNLIPISIDPQETEKFEIHLISFQEADVIFSIQVLYFLGAEPSWRILTLPSTFEVMFFDKSSKSLYRLQEGQFIKTM